MKLCCLPGLSKVSLRATCLPGSGGWLWLVFFVPFGTGRTHLPLVGRGLGSLSKGGLHPISPLSHSQQLEVLIERIPFCL